ncbi:MAG: hypothetical protein A2V67_07860 [Deltaproteobacteria bacterium RBG_13_61_14]|nr:MAG: hypothetical protein A2V67_07860 [Deltaproteobacteria bacterium RBG_13_61_14]
MGDTIPIKPPRIPAWVKQAVPVLVSIGILYYYFHDQDWPKFLAACGQADLRPALIAIFLPQLVMWFFSALLVERTIRWFHGPFPFWTFFWIQGTSYILMFLNSALGGGGLLLYQQRKARISWRKLLGIALFRFGMVMWGMGFLMIPVTLALHYYGLADKARINLYVWWFILIFPGVLFFFGSWFFWFRGTDYTGLGRIIVRDRESEFWTAFRLATRRQWVLTWAMMALPFVLMLVGFYFLNRAFAVNVPLSEFLVVAPLALLVMDLPIAFGGFGTATLAWMTFFGHYGSPENIAALSLFLPFARALCRGLIALVSLRPALKDISSLVQAPEPESGKLALEVEEA